MQKTAIILDDEINALEHNQRIINQVAYIKTLGAYTKMLDAEKKIIELRPDILFLDIKIRGYFVFEMLDRLKHRDIRFTIIFISAYIQEQLENIIKSIGFKNYPFGYIHKPISLEKLELQLEDYKIYVPQNSISKDKKSVLVKVPNENAYTRYLLKNVLYFWSEDKHTYFYYIKEGQLKKKIINGTLKKLEQILPKPPFYRMSNKYIINTDYFHKAIKDNPNWICHFEAEGIQLKESHQLPIPEKKWFAFKNEFGI